MKESKQNTENTTASFSLIDRYKLLIEARNFHYENFNKWMSYFYVMIGALFVGLTTIDKIKNIELYWMILTLGCIVSLFWYWSHKGYYYWNINFISLVNYYEKILLNFDEDKRVYFVFANKSEQNNFVSPIKGANISTSKVSILLSFIFTVFWGSIFANELFKSLNEKNKCLVSDYPFFYFISIALIVISLILLVTSIIPSKYLKSHHKHFPDLGIDQSKEWRGKKEAIHL